MNDESLSAWIGRTESRTEYIGESPVATLSVTLDRGDPAPQSGDPIPPLWHWLYFLPRSPLSESGPDGHAARGGFLPPVPLPRRMWGGGRLQFLDALRIGDTATRTSRIVDVTKKAGRSGPLVFVLVRHEVARGGRPLIVEEHDIVYREAPKAGAAEASRQASAERTWSREIHPDAVLLFRYSALTFNSHRIHYDFPYVTKIEGYPDLVVHGPLIATLLVDLLRRSVPHVRVSGFDFRAVSPLFANAPFLVCGQPAPDGTSARLWAQRPDGALAMEATARMAT